MCISIKKCLSSRLVWIIYQIHANLNSSCCHGEHSSYLCLIEIQDLVKLHLLFACCPLWFKSLPLSFIHSTYVSETTQWSEEFLPDHTELQRRNEDWNGAPCTHLSHPFLFSLSFLRHLLLNPLLPHPRPGPQRGGLTTVAIHVIVSRATWLRLPASLGTGDGGGGVGDGPGGVWGGGYRDRALSGWEE